MALVDAEGISRTVTALNTGDSVDTKGLVYWIDSNTGAGQVGNMLRREPDVNVGAVD